MAEVGASPIRAERGVPAHPLAPGAPPPSRTNEEAEAKKMARKSRDAKSVVQWRALELLQYGFPPGLAKRVAKDQRYQLHDLIDLVERGCSPALAVQILSPLDGSGQLAEARE